MFNAKNKELLNLKDIDTYIFDYGGVVSFHYCEPWQGNLSKILGVSREVVDSLLSETSQWGRAYRLSKISRDFFWEQIIKSTNALNANPEELEFNWANSYQIDQRMLKLAERLKKEKGFQVGIFSNSDQYRHKHIEDKYKLSEKINFIISSHIHGVIKPEIEAYNVALSVADRMKDPHKVLYVDDRERNISPVVNVGMKGYVFSDYENFFLMLKENGIIN